MAVAPPPPNVVNWDLAWILVGLVATLVGAGFTHRLVRVLLVACGWVALCALAFQLRPLAPAFSSLDVWIAIVGMTVGLFGWIVRPVISYVRGVKDPVPTPGPIRPAHWPGGPDDDRRILTETIARVNAELRASEQREEAAKEQASAAQQQLAALRHQRDNAQRLLQANADQVIRVQGALDAQAAAAKSLHDELRDVNARWAGIAPYIDAVRRVERLAFRLAQFMDTVSANMPNHLTPSSSLAEIWVVGSETNKRQYEASLQPDLVRLAADLKASFGLVRPGLSDENLTPTLVLENTIQPMIDALVNVRDDLMVRLAREATKE